MKSYVKISKLILSVMFAFTLCTTFLSASYTTNAAAKKLSSKDFVYENPASKESKSFIKANAKSKWAFYFVSTASGNLEFETSRKLNLGSSYSKVKATYGNASKKKLNANDKCYLMLTAAYPNLDVSAWKYYSDYNYKKGSATYTLRFYYDSKSKVCTIVYIKNLKKIPATSKESNIKIHFVTQKGKKVTTKKIDGKKVYLIPKNTKIYFTEKTKKFDKIYYKINLFGSTSNACSDIKRICIKEKVSVESLLKATYYNCSTDSALSVYKSKPKSYSYYTITITGAMKNKYSSAIKDFKQPVFYFRYVK